MAAELEAARGRLASAMNNLAGPYGKQYRSCIADLYYATFHAATALLASRGLRARTHDAAQELLALHFVKPAALGAEAIKRMNALMERRHSADYKTYVPIDAADVAEFKPWVGTFLRDTIRLLGASAPRREATALAELLKELDRL
ncbi:MAG: HEPN domain-containing protein [Betaproteobacteria bacterium]